MISYLSVLISNDKLNSAALMLPDLNLSLLLVYPTSIQSKQLEEHKPSEFGLPTTPEMIHSLSSV